MLSNLQKQRLREDFSFCADPNSELRSIALVGGVFNAHSNYGLYEGDENLLKRALLILREKGLKISPEFEPVIVNLNEEHGGIDFMDPDNLDTFDISIFCYIKRIIDPKERTQNPKNYFIRNSDHETTTRHSWLNAALAHNSKVLITHGIEKAEVTGRDFKGGWFRNRSPYKLIHTEGQEFRDSPIRLSGARIDVLAHRTIS